MFHTWVVVVAVIVCIGAIAVAFVLAETIKHGKPATSVPYRAWLGGDDLGGSGVAIGWLGTGAFENFELVNLSPIGSVRALAMDAQSVTAVVQDGTFATAMTARVPVAWSGAADVSLQPHGSIHKWGDRWWVATELGIGSSSDGVTWGVNAASLDPQPGEPLADIALAPDGTVVMVNFTDTESMFLSTFDTATGVTTGLNAPGIRAQGVAPRAALWAGTSRLALFNSATSDLGDSPLVLCPWGALNACEAPATPPARPTLSSVVQVSTATWFACDDASVWRSTDNGDTWADVTPSVPLNTTFSMLGSLTSDIALLLANSGAPVAYLYSRSSAASSWGMLATSFTDVALNAVTAAP